MLNRLRVGQRPKLSLLSALILVLFTGHVQAANPLRIAISLSEFPNLWGQPDGGFEGVRFGGYTLYDAMVQWDLSSADKPSRLIPALADSWTVDEAKKRWTFKLREAKFHDGTPWNADAFVWNVDAILDAQAPQFNASHAAGARSKFVTVASYGKIDDYTVFIETSKPDSFLLYELSAFFFVSPAGFAAAGSDWNAFSTHPVGTGPYKFVSVASRRELVLTANRNYWNPKRIPKTETLVLTPIADANTRVAALRSGQVDVIESVTPDSIDSLKASGFQIAANVYPHTWLWRLNFTPESPFSDIRIRKAVNLAIDRDAVSQLVSGTGVPARAFAPPTAPWFGKPAFAVKFDPEAAKKLLAEAGYGPGKRLKLRVIISASGGGQMVPLSMNEIIQANLRDVGVDVSYDVVDFTAMVTSLRESARKSGADGINVAMTMQDPTGGIANYESILAPPAVGNWGFYSNPDYDAAIRAARAEFDPAKQEQALAKVNEALTNDAAAILVVHDTGPRALSPKVKGFVPAQNWYQDFTTIEVAP